MSTYSSQLEQLIEDLGGCGLMQKLLCIIIQSASIVTVWSMLAMAFIGYDPGFNCQTLNVKFSSLSALNLSDISTHRLCSIGPYETCSVYAFPNNINTAVSEWNLVCDKRWIVAFITSIQMVGVLIGSVSGGQMADSIGRKPTLLTAVTSMVLFNFIGYFTQSWQTYLIIRFFIGIGVGLWFTVQFSQMIEFVPSSWRPLVVCFPSEPIISMLYALLSWLLNDWKRIHLLKTIMGMIALIVLWFSVNTAWTCMALGMESISVDIYLTIFLINLVDVFAYSVTGPLLNRFGRKKYCLVVCCVSSVLACVSGTLQHLNKLSMSSIPLKLATLIMSLLTKMMVTMAVTTLIVYTLELYPTVVRTIGYGFQSTVGRLGAIAAPLLIYLDGLFPGFMYFTSGILIFLSVGVIARLKETKDVLLSDSL